MIIVDLIVFLLGFVIVIMIAGMLTEYFKGLEIVFDNVIGGLYEAGKSVALALKDIFKNKK